MPDAARPSPRTLPSFERMNRRMRKYRKTFSFFPQWRRLVQHLRQAASTVGCSVSVAGQSAAWFQRRIHGAMIAAAHCRDLVQTSLEYSMNRTSLTLILLALLLTGCSGSEAPQQATPVDAAATAPAAAMVPAGVQGSGVEL